MRSVLTSFGGGVIAVVIVWGALARQIFDNLNAVASARGERVEELERELNQERSERKRDIANMEIRHRHEIDKLTSQIHILEKQYQSVVAEKAALVVALAGQSKP
jgi:hypothetical protein